LLLIGFFMMFFGKIFKLLFIWGFWGRNPFVLCEDMFVLLANG